MRILTVSAWLLVAAVPTARGQVIPQPPPQQQPQPRDTIKVPQFRVEPPISPLGAMWRSLVLPGWGQAVLKRRVTGAAFVFFEGVTLFMTIKSVEQLHFQERTDAETVDDKRQEVQDWVVLLGFNHFLAAAEAFVSAQLSDFPVDLEARALPSGDTGVGIGIGF